MPCDKDITINKSASYIKFSRCTIGTQINQTFLNLKCQLFSTSMVNLKENVARIFEILWSVCSVHRTDSGEIHVCSWRYSTHKQQREHAAEASYLLELVPSIACIGTYLFGYWVLLLISLLTSAWNGLLACPYLFFTLFLGNLTEIGQTVQDWGIATM